MRKTKAKYMNLNRREGLKAHLFLLPFYIGLYLFFIGPITQSIVFSFNDVVTDVGSYKMTFVGLKNYNYAFFRDPEFLNNLVSSLVELLWKLPVILISSVFFATILNQKFKGRVFVRAVFFLPIIIASGMVLSIVQGDFIAGKVLAGGFVSGGEITQSNSLQDFLSASGLSDKIIKVIMTIANNMFTTMWQTGVQTIIFLAGLQSIPSSLYEAASVEGASSWESFWKITVPMLLPILSVNIIYTVVDYFTSTSSLAMKQIINNTNSSRFGWASAMAWSYFAIIAILLAVLMLIVGKISKNVLGGRR